MSKKEVKITTPKREVKFTKVLLVRVTPEVHDAIVALAEENERTVAGEVRRALRIYLYEEDK